MRLRRHCYNKMWRCPCWAGGGWRTPRKVHGERDCNCGGSLKINWEPRWKAFWSFHRCQDENCDVLVIPHVTRLVDPTYIWWHIKWKARDLYRYWTVERHWK